MRLVNPKNGSGIVSRIGAVALFAAAACSPDTSSPAQSAGGTAPLGSARPTTLAGGAAVAPMLAANSGAASGAAGVSGLPATRPVTAPAAGGGAVAPAASSAPLPCDVAEVVAKKCATCHGSMPVGGAPMPLVSQTDFSKEIKSIRTVPGQMAPVGELVKKRINDSAMPMPPGELLPEAERAVLNAWLDKGHPVGTDTSACKQPGGDVSQPAEATAIPSAKVRKADDGSTCYQLRNHGEQKPGDTTPYTVIPGEHYVSFYFKAPWTEPSEIVGFNTLYDKRAVLHHWLLYTTLGSDMDGNFAPGIGTHLGDAAQLLAGWAVGGNDVELPKDVALRLPPPGAGVMIEWHFYNPGAETVMDSSGIEVCVMPQGTRKHTAGMTWLGTENFNGPIGMPAKAVSEYGGTCAPSRTGLGESDPIHIFILWPHMHKFGRHMQSIVTRAADGRQEEVFSKPFDFNYQITYDTSIDLFPGDVITSTCKFENTSNSSVPFGPSSDQEMCYQFAYSYPAGALENGVPSLVGATNTCW